jgi:hypothetical protein
MNSNKGLYVLQLKSVATGGQSDGLLKKWASGNLAHIEAKNKSSSKQVKPPDSIKSNTL